MTKLYQSGDRYYFWCPGCKEPHFYQTAGSPAWQFNGDLEQPTFSPSLRILTRREDRDHTCHLFLTLGNLQFCADCSHEYRSQTVPLPDWEREENAMHRTIKKSIDQPGNPPATPAPAPAAAGTNAAPVASNEEWPFFLEPAEHVAVGLEDREVVIAKDQPQYRPLPALFAGDERGTMLTRWTLSPNARKAVAEGADLYLEVMTFGKPFQPVVMFACHELSKNTIESGFFARNLTPAAETPENLAKKEAVGSAAGANALEQAPEPSDEKATAEAEEVHEAHHIQCATCKVWYNKNDASCPNCATRTPIVVGG